jgi:hypothetical protein
VKRLSADDSADSRVKVGHHQAIYMRSKRAQPLVGPFLFAASVAEFVYRYGSCSSGLSGRKMLT